MYSFANGPPPARTGAPGEETCAQAACHTGTVNENGVKVELVFEGGANYSPGVNQKVTVRITEPQNGPNGVFGFQLTARLASDETQQAGKLIRVETDVFVQCSDGSMREAEPNNGTCPAGQAVEFIQHVYPKQTGEWTVDWLPPATDLGSIRFYVAGTAALGNRQPIGDKTYTASYTLTPGARGQKGKGKQ